MPRSTAPERRRARHVLVTINEEFAENRREAALARIRQAENELRTQSFEHVAQRYSECPTAVNGGLLGDVRRALGARELWQGKSCDSPLVCPAVFLGAGGVSVDF